MKCIKNIKEAVYVGWFGPVGVAALLYANLKAEIQHIETVWHVVTLVITCSIGQHGLSATPLTRQLHRTDEEDE